MAGHKTIWSVGGGKEGAGKSIVTANLGCILAQRGKKVILVDPSPAGGLLPLFGLEGRGRSLEDFLSGAFRNIEDVALQTPVTGLRLIKGAEFLGIADTSFPWKRKLTADLRNIDADYIIVDLGPGASGVVLDFFAISGEGIVVLAPEPASIQHSYNFLKSFVYRRLERLFSDNPLLSEMIKEATDKRSPNSVKTFSDLCERISKEDRRAAERALSEIKSFRPRLLLNMASSREDVKAVETLMAASSTFLSLNTDFIGTLFLRPPVKKSAGKKLPFMLDAGAKEARKDMEEAVSLLLGEVAEKPAEEPAYEVFGFNDNVSHMGTVFHVQTEVQGGANPTVETVIYNGGRIFFSKKSSWSEISKYNEGKSLRDSATKQHRTAMAAIKMNKITLQG